MNITTSKLQKLIAAFCLMLVLCLSAAAGEMQTPITNPPPGEPGQSQISPTTPPLTASTDGGTLLSMLEIGLNIFNPFLLY